MVRILIVALVLLAGAVMAARHLENTGRAPVAMTSTPAPVSPPARNVVLTKDRNGHFQVDARVGGRRLEFLVDTGASHMALRESAAARLGIYPRPSDFTVRVSTANGVTKAALVQLPRCAGDRSCRRGFERQPARDVVPRTRALDSRAREAGAGAVASQVSWP
jgi:aspartyl protease family protein